LYKWVLYTRRKRKRKLFGGSSVCGDVLLWDDGVVLEDIGRGF